jgi:hypothetical protein
VVESIGLLNQCDKKLCNVMWFNSTGRNPRPTQPGHASGVISRCEALGRM